MVSFILQVSGATAQEIWGILVASRVLCDPLGLHGYNRSIDTHAGPAAEDGLLGITRESIILYDKIMIHYLIW